MKKTKRILALIGVVLLLGLYLITFIAAVTSTPASAGLFKACIYSTVVIPTLLYVYIMIYKLFGKNHKDSDSEDPKDDYK